MEPFDCAQDRLREIQELVFSPDSATLHLGYGADINSQVIMSQSFPVHPERSISEVEGCTLGQCLNEKQTGMTRFSLFCVSDRQSCQTIQ